MSEECMKQKYTLEEVCGLLGDAWDLTGLLSLAKNNVYSSNHVEMMAAIRQAQNIAAWIVQYFQDTCGVMRIAENKKNEPAAKAMRQKGV